MPLTGGGTGVTAYPTSSDLSSYLMAHGFTSVQIESLGYAAALRAGIERVERATGRTFLASSSTTRRYDPPTDIMHTLQIEDLSSSPTIVYTPQDSTSETLTVNSDYWLYPHNALAEGLPYSRIQFFRSWYSPLSSVFFRSLAITGYWGYGTTSTGYPEDVYQAMLAASAIYLLPQIRNSIVGNVIEWKQADVSKKFGDMPYAGLHQAWAEQYQHVVNTYKKIYL